MKFSSKEITARPQFINQDTRQQRLYLRACLCEIIKKIRLESRMTRTDVAKQLGIKPDKLTMIQDCGGDNIKIDSLILYLLRCNAKITITVEHGDEISEDCISRSLSSVLNEPKPGNL